LFLALPAVVLASLLAAPTDSVPELSTSMVKAADGKLVLEVSGTAPAQAKWLGVSFYLPNYTDVTWGGEHFVSAVSEGQFRLSFMVPDGYEAGTYEAGLWREKLGENTFYWPELKRAYGTGTIKTGPAHTMLADTVSLLKTEVTSKDGSKTLQVSGTASEAGLWLGVSFYKSGYTDAVLDGRYSMQRVEAKGSFSRSVAVPEGFEDGTYEVALWRRLASKKKVYRMSGELGYGSGKVGE